MYIRDDRGNAEAEVKYAFRISHPIRHELSKQEQYIKKYIQAERRTPNPSMSSPLRSLCSFVVKSFVAVNGYDLRYRRSVQLTLGVAQREGGQLQEAKAIGQNPDLAEFNTAWILPTTHLSLLSMSQTLKFSNKRFPIFEITLTLLSFLLFECGCKRFDVFETGMSQKRTMRLGI